MRRPTRTANFEWNIRRDSGQNRGLRRADHLPATVDNLEFETFGRVAIQGRTAGARVEQKPPRTAAIHTHGKPYAAPLDVERDHVKRGGRRRLTGQGRSGCQAYQPHGRRTHALHAKFDTSLSGFVPPGFRRDIFVVRTQ